jgi:hypothetical protein
VGNNPSDSDVDWLCEGTNLSDSDVDWLCEGTNLSDSDVDWLCEGNNPSDSVNEREYNFLLNLMFSLVKSVM